jgi:hypothetical protein
MELEDHAQKIGSTEPGYRGHQNMLSGDNNDPYMGEQSAHVTQ